MALKILKEAIAKNPGALAEERDSLKALGMVEASSLPFSAYDETDTETVQMMFPNTFKAFCSFIHELTDADKRDLDYMDTEWDTLEKRDWDCFMEYIDILSKGAGAQADKLFKKYYQAEN